MVKGKRIKNARGINAREISSIEQIEIWGELALRDVISSPSQFWNSSIFGSSPSISRFTLFRSFPNLPCVISKSFVVANQRKATTRLYRPNHSIPLLPGYWIEPICELSYNCPPRFPSVTQLLPWRKQHPKTMLQRRVF